MFASNLESEESGISVAYLGAMQTSSKSILWVLAVSLALVVFFAVRFVKKGTALEGDSKDPTAVSKFFPSKQDNNASNAQKTAEQIEPPPDRAIKELVRTWNQGSAEDIAGLFIADGTLIIPTGPELRSSAEIAKTISEKRAGVLRQTTLTNTVEKVSRPDPNTAVVQGTYKLDGIKIGGIRTSATGWYTLRQIKREGRWLISRAELKKGDNG